jgi:RNA polymerase sigma-70 factor (ECF subfamily)
VEADVDELIQAVFVVAWQRMDSIPVGNECAWLIAVARNVLNNARRSFSRRQARHRRIVPRGDEPSAEDYFIADETLREALRSLGESDRELLLLHHWEGMEADELAVFLGVRPGAAATRLSRASSRLRESFSALGGSAVNLDADRT